MPEPLIDLLQVQKAYGTEAKTIALRDVTLSVGAGEFVAILGPSGSGKSSLLNLLGALDRPTSGEVRIGGRSLGTLSEAELTDVRREYLGFVFQFHLLLPDFTALENVLMPTLIRGGGKAAITPDEGRELLRRVGLQGFENRRPSQLSGGQQQRVAIARALAGQKPIILADEPTGNLDTRTSREVFALMREFHESDGTTFLVITHDRSLARQADRIIEIIDGAIHYDGPTSDYTAPDH